MNKQKPTVSNNAIKESAQLRRQRGILSLFGKIEYDESYDYKQARRSKRLGDVLSEPEIRAKKPLEASSK